jgi:hypothetical protein
VALIGVKVLVPMSWANVDRLAYVNCASLISIENSESHYAMHYITVGAAGSL